jgi:hypothetical protein
MRLEAERGNLNKENIREFYDQLKSLVDVVTQISSIELSGDEIQALGEAAIKFADKKIPELKPLTEKMIKSNYNDISFSVRPKGLYYIISRLLGTQSWFNEKANKGIDFMKRKTV